MYELVASRVVQVAKNKEALALAQERVSFIAAQMASFDKDVSTF